MKFSLNLLFLFLAIMQNLQSEAKDLQVPSDFQSELRPNSFLEWLLSIFQTPPLNLIPPLTSTPPTTALEECLPCSCGTPNTRIVGGEESQMLKYPWMALVTYYGQFVCGGALISDLYVVTAAHCLSGYSASSIAVRLLVHDRRKNTTKEIDRKARRIISHENYNPRTLYNDIGVIRLNLRVEMSDILRPVCLPSADKIYTGEMGIVTGWGAVKESGPQADKLMEVSLPIISNEECIKKYDSRRITELMLCAGYQEGNKDSCQGDSGGPFHVYSEMKNIYHLAGVVSWGIGCARPNMPGVYTRVSKYLDWLEKQTRGSCKCMEPTMKLK